MVPVCGNKIVLLLSGITFEEVCCLPTCVSECITWSRGVFLNIGHSSSELHMTHKCSLKGSRTLHRNVAEETSRAQHMQSDSLDPH